MATTAEKPQILPIYDIKSAPATTLKFGYTHDYTVTRPENSPVMLALIGDTLYTVDGTGMAQVAVDIALKCSSVRIDERGYWKIGDRDTGVRARGVSPRIYHGTGDDNHWLMAECHDDAADKTQTVHVFDFDTIADNIFRARLALTEADLDGTRLKSAPVAVAAPAGKEYIITRRGNAYYMLLCIDDLRVKYRDLTDAEKKQFADQARLEWDEQVQKMEAKLREISEMTLRAEAAATAAEEAALAARSSASSAEEAALRADAATADADTAADTANAAALDALRAADRADQAADRANAR